MAYHLDLRVLTAQEVAELLTCEEVVAAVEETFRRAGAGLLFHPIKGMEKAFKCSAVLDRRKPQNKRIF